MWMSRDMFGLMGETIQSHLFRNWPKDSSSKQYTQHQHQRHSSHTKNSYHNKPDHSNRHRSQNTEHSSHNRSQHNYHNRSHHNPQNRSHNRQQYKYSTKVVIVPLVFRKLLYINLFDFLLTSLLTSTFPCNFFSPELSYPYVILRIPIHNHWSIFYLFPSNYSLST